MSQPTLVAAPTPPTLNPRVMSTIDSSLERPRQFGSRPTQSQLIDVLRQIFQQRGDEHAILLKWIAAHSAETNESKSYIAEQERMVLDENMASRKRRYGRDLTCIQKRLDVRVGLQKYISEDRHMTEWFVIGKDLVHAYQSLPRILCDDGKTFPRVNRREHSRWYRYSNECNDTLRKIALQFRILQIHSREIFPPM